MKYRGEESALRFSAQHVIHENFLHSSDVALQFANFNV